YQNVQLLIFHHLVLYNDLHRLSGRLFLRSMVCPSVPTGSHLSGLFGDDGISSEVDAVSSNLRQEHGRRTRTLWINFLRNSTCHQPFKRFPSLRINHCFDFIGSFIGNLFHFTFLFCISVMSYQLDT
ncbi:hypothetical protein CEXT_638651, partial [Caerostris extrusa]